MVAAAAVVAVVVVVVVTLPAANAVAFRIDNISEGMVEATRAVVAGEEDTQMTV